VKCLWANSVLNIQDRNKTPKPKHQNMACDEPRSFNTYRLLPFPICQLGSHNITPSHCSSPDDALNPPSSSPPPYPRRHAFVAGIAVSTSAINFPLSPNTPAVHYFMSKTDDRSKVHAKHVHIASDSQRNNNPNPSQLTNTTANAFTTMTPPDVARPLSQPCSCTSS